MRRLTTTAAAALGLAALALTGCTGSASDAAPASDDAATTEGGTVAFASLSPQVPIISALGDQAAEILGGAGFDVVVQDANFDPVQQAQQLEQAANTGSIIGAWIFPVAPEALAPTVQLMQEKRLPILVMAAPEDFGFDEAQPGIVFSSSDFAEYGETMAKEAASCAVETGATEAIFLKAPEFAGGAAAVSNGVQTAYAEATPGAPIVDTAEAADLASAQTAVSQLLIAHPSVSVVIAGTDETGLGAIAAFKAAGKTPDCLIVGGGGPDVLAAQEAGDVTAVVGWDYDTASKEAGEDLIRLLGDPTAVGGIFGTPIVVTK